MVLIPTKILSNGVEIPSIGLGTYPMIGAELTSAITSAYHSGYSLIDTADNYYNEQDLGVSLKYLYSIGAKRNNFFLTTKISDELYKPGTLGGGYNKGKYFWRSSPHMQSPNAVHEIVRMKCEDSLRKLQTDYIDLLLMHWPYPDYFEEIWYEMEQIYREGKVRAIGVCNCRERHLEKILKNNLEIPMVNQIETSPFNTKESLIKYCCKNNIQVLVYSPLMSLRVSKSLGIDSSILENIAIKHNKTISQVLLRFDVQRGLIPIPKSANPKRLQENINIFDFELSSSEMEYLASLNINMQTLPESKSCPGL